MSGNAGRSRGRRPAASSWEPVASWYDGWVGDRGSRYHQAAAIPAVLDLLDPQRGEEILDVGAGQGVLAPYITERGARYTGVELSPRLVEIARSRSVCVRPSEARRWNGARRRSSIDSTGQLYRE